MFKSYELLEWEDLFNVEHPKYKKLSSIRSYDVVYNQDSLLLIRIPEILKIFECINCIQVNTSYRFMSIGTRGLSPIKTKEVLTLLHSNIARMKYFAVAIEYGYIRIATKPKFVDEPFEVYRNRLLFELRDAINISHQGYGKDSVMLPSKYTASRFELNQEINPDG